MTAAVVLLTAAIAVLCLGGLIGSSLTTQALEHQSRRQAAERRRLNDEWRALDTARGIGGSGCSGCRGLTQSNWIVLIDRPDEED